MQTSSTRQVDEKEDKMNNKKKGEEVELDEYVVVGHQLARSEVGEETMDDESFAPARMQNNITPTATTAAAATTSSSSSGHGNKKEGRRSRENSNNSSSNDMFVSPLLMDVSKDGSKKKKKKHHPHHHANVNKKTSAATSRPSTNLVDLDQLRRDKNIQVFSAFATGDLKPDEATPEDTDALLFSSSNSNILENFNFSPSSSTDQNIHTRKQLGDDGSVRRLIDSPSNSFKEENDEEEDAKNRNKAPENDSKNKFVSKELFSAWIQQTDEATNNSGNFSDDDDDVVMENKSLHTQNDATSASNDRNSNIDKNTKQKSETSSSSSKTRLSANEKKAMEDEADAQRRRQEMNWFASNANSDMGNSTFTNMSSTTNTTTTTNNNNDVNKSTFVAPNKDSKTTTDGQSSTGTDTGRSKQQNNNIAAALKSMTDTTDQTASSSITSATSMISSSTLNNPYPLPMTSTAALGPHAAAPKKPKCDQMYSECVLLPRPLFFGSNLPPRIYEEAKLAISSHINNKKSANETSLRSSPPPQYSATSTKQHPFFPHDNSMIFVTSPSSTSTIAEEEDTGEDDLDILLASYGNHRNNNNNKIDFNTKTPQNNRINSTSRKNSDSSGHIFSNFQSPNVNNNNNNNNNTQQTSKSSWRTSWIYRNLEESIMVFGNGVGTKLFWSTSIFDNHDQNHKIKTSSYLTNFSPVCGDRAKFEREERIRKESLKKVEQSVEEEISQSNSIANSIQRSSDDNQFTPETNSPGMMKTPTQTNVNKNKDSSRSNQQYNITTKTDKDVNSTPLNKSNASFSSTYQNRLTNDIPSPSAPTPVISNQQKKSNLSNQAQHDDAISTPPKNHPLTTSATSTSADKDKKNSNDAGQMSTNLFLQYARGGDTWDTQSGTLSAVPEGKVPDQQLSQSNTFRPIYQNSKNDSGSFEGSELKKQVGLNDNISKALRSLGGNSTEAGNDGSLTAADAGTFAKRAQAFEGYRFATEDGRTYTNLELTGGRVPLYGCDDTPLPIEADLGTYETTDDERKYNERRDSEHIIESVAVPSIFGSVVCPSPCLGPDDSQTWNNRTVLGRGGDGSNDHKAYDHIVVSNNNNRNTSTVDSLSSLRSIASEPPNLRTKAGRPLPSPPPITSNNSSGDQNRHRSDSSRVSTFTTQSASRAQSLDPAKQQSRQQKPNITEHSRVGWWNTSDEFGLQFSTMSNSDDFGGGESGNNETFDNLVQLPHISDESKLLDVNTNLNPTPNMLRAMNKSMDNLHPITPLARHLPYLSDRPPSTRYIQIDARAVGFPPVGEVEPLFCSLAIWNVEATSATGSKNNLEDNSDNKSVNSIAPVPHLSRCGCVTESLHFDIVNSADVKEKCKNSLWPDIFKDKKTTGKNESSHTFEKTTPQERLVGSRSGVFPLASNFHISNLYAVLIVHKVLSEESDIGIYLKSNKHRDDKSSHKTKNSSNDIVKLRNKAAKTTERFGRILTPFAFGVAPLVQVLGTASPNVPFSRAVQIPLFKLIAGNGDKPIIDHIMVMLFPRANHINGRKPADLTRGGTATLVMRNFGYLGLHSAVHSKSSLARDRLVDFTGELQIRRRNKDDKLPKEDGDSGRIYVAPLWHSDFVGEPVLNGGRNIIQNITEDDEKVQAKDDLSKSRLYTQELAQIPLSIFPPSNRASSSKITQGGIKGGIPMAGNDVEPYFHTSLYNEILCQPRLLHNCARRNIVVKIELRTIRWSEVINAFVATIPSCGPAIHNQRRGTFLSQEAFTCCAYHTVDPKFLDEFKVKLPLAIGNQKGEGRLVFLFSVYNVTVKGKRKWTSTMRATLGRQSQSEDDGSISTEYIDPSSKQASAGSMTLLGSGYLPLTQGDEIPCLISNGLHDVKIRYLTRSLTSNESRGYSLKNEVDGHYLHNKEREQLERTFPPDTLVIEPLKKLSSDVSTPVTTPRSQDNHFSDECSEKSFLPDDIFLSPMSDGDNQRSGLSPMSQNSSTSELTETPKNDDAMILQVRTISLSSLHSQNQSLAMFFCHCPPPPRCLSNKELISPFGPWTMSRKELQSQIDSDFATQKNASSGPVAEEFRKLIRYTVEISKGTLCPPNELCSHLLRIQFQLWRAMVSGIGGPSLRWANPASLISLRLHSFATLLTIFSSVTIHMSKHGATQLDGKSKWNLTSMGRVIALLFDEEALFFGPDGLPLEDYDDVIEANLTSTENDPALEEVENADFIGKSHSPPKTKRGRGHARKPSLEQMNIEFIPGGLDSKTNDKNTSIPDKIDPSPLLSSSFLSNELEGLNIGDSKNDILLPTKPKPIGLGIRAVSDSKREIRIDTKADFQSHLNAANCNDSSPVPSQGTNRKGNASGFFSGPAASRRKYMTAPSFSQLCTIQEDTDKMEEVVDGSNTQNDSPASGASSGIQSGFNEKESNKIQKGSEGTDILDSEMTRRSSTKPKQMRIPKVHKSNSSASDTSSKVETDSDKSVPNKVEPKGSPTSNSDFESTVSYLDRIGQGLGLPVSKKDMGGEEKRVGFAHHIRTRSSCSIDWSLPGIDKLVENHQELEQIQRQENSNQLKASINQSNDEKLITSHSRGKVDVSLNSSISKGNKAKSNESENNSTEQYSPTNVNRQEVDKYESMKSNKSDDESSKKQSIKLPNFIDRIMILGKNKKISRWFPYTYEVIIFQWVALLVQQTKVGEQTNNMKRKTTQTKSKNNADNESKALKSGDLQTTPTFLSDAALRARGVTIGCAPILFEIIKKSLAWRIDIIFRRSKQKSQKSSPKSSELEVPPLVRLDDEILSKLEELITLVTDACIDSRNFDSWQFRQTSSDVNDSIVLFLRDLFSYLEAPFVHRLVLIYFSRFLMKEGKHWHDRDSKIGLRCSWEICKLRLNAITLFIRHSDFFKLNCPIMENWGSWPLAAPPRLTRQFFNNALEELESLGMPEFSATEGPILKSAIVISPWRPHWLVELVTDVCLTAAGHVEQNIQYRASAILYELFWKASQVGKVNGTLSIVSSLFVPFIVKLLGHIQYLANLSPRNQLRKDLLPSFIFILQSAPVGLMRALWRKLCKRAEGKSLHPNINFGGIGEYHVSDQNDNDAKNHERNASNIDKDEEQQLPSIFEVFSLLNLSLRTLEYEGSDFNTEEEVGDDTNQNVSIWKKEYLCSLEDDVYSSLNVRQGQHYSVEREKNTLSQRYTTSNSRKWVSHDAAIVIIKASRYIVREVNGMLKPSQEMSSPGTSVSSSSSGNAEGSFEEARGSGRQSRRKSRLKKGHSTIEPYDTLKFSAKDKIYFARGITSVYLHCLSLRQSDVVYKKTLIASVEIVKVFGVKIFLAAIGESLQHWMRVVLVHCGARRAEVRVQALEFLALLLRLTWNSYGSFYRVRVPLLAVQTEVMERIVATAAARYYREQRRQECLVQYLSNEMAEASLAPLWRTLDRLHYQSASRNIAFKCALERLAKKMKTLFGAYVAAHALAIVNRTKSLPSTNNHLVKKNKGSLQSTSASSYLSTLTRHSQRVSAGFSKRYLGPGVSFQSDAVTHNEAVEDAFLAAADVFSLSELPSHRVAWLQKLADFHNSREKYAEEATCRFYIHCTLRQAAVLHQTLWNSVPFFPWANDSSDGVHLEGDGPVGEAGDYSDNKHNEDFKTNDLDSELKSGRVTDKNDSFRRIFYRVANSVRMRTGDWDVSGNKNLFYGVTFASEYMAISPWMSLREIEEDMVDEAESAGELFLKAGIVESSRYSWNLVTKFYSEMFNYGRLAGIYGKLARVVASEIPVVDTSNQLEMSSPLGRFYRVYFHGAAPDELMGAEFVYRAKVLMKLEEFGHHLSTVIKSILPNKTPIDLVLDDGRPDDPQRRQAPRKLLGAPTLDPIKIKITPLRPLFFGEKCCRGTPEWFHVQTESCGFVDLEKSETITKKSVWDNSDGKRSVSNNSEHSQPQMSTSTNGRLNLSSAGGGPSVGGALFGVDTFSFNLPFHKKNRMRTSRDWLKGPKSEKSIKVTRLQVPTDFPACVTRQKVAKKTVLYQSPLEAGIDATCSWCSVLFRTAVATSGLALIGTQADEGIGRDAVKVVSESIHCSRVKEIGLEFLSNKESRNEEMDKIVSVYDTLSPAEVSKNEIRLARSIVAFMELLHLLICRNRDLLLSVIKARKRMKDGASVGSISLHGGSVRPTYRHIQAINEGYVSDDVDRDRRFGNSVTGRSPSHSYYDTITSNDTDIYRTFDDISAPYISAAASVSSQNDRTVDACSLQRELQRAFTSMARSLYPVLVKTIKNETPRWIKVCWQDSKYYSSGIYRRTRTAMGEELFFYAGNSQSVRNSNDFERPKRGETINVPISNILTRSSSPHNSYGGSIGSKNSIGSKKSRNSTAESRSGWRMKDSSSSN